MPATAAEWGIAPQARPLVDEILEKFPVRITSGRRSPAENRRVGGATRSDHLTGLGVDIVPDETRGGTWEDVDRVARWAEPQQGQPRAPFRWVGYDGDAGHGRGDHLHLSIDPAQVSGDRSFIDRLGDLADPRDILGIGEQVAKDPTAVAGTVAEQTAQAFGKLIIDAIGADGARALMYVLLVGGGMTLAVVGAARAAGVRPAHVAQLAQLAPPVRGAKIAKGAAA